MRFALLFILTMLMLNLGAQRHSIFSNKSAERLVYRISADSSEKYLLKSHIPLEIYAARTPDYRFHIDSFDEEALPKGHYLVVWTRSYEIHATVVIRSDLFVFPLHNQKTVQLAVWNKHSGEPANLRAWYNGKPLLLNGASKTFSLSGKIDEDALIRVSSDDDTTFLHLEIDSEAERSVAAQRWKRFWSSGAGRTMTFLPRKVGALFKQQKRYRYKGSATKGLMVFNQPKYKIGDTVRLKAHLLQKNNRPYRKPVDVQLSYYFRGKSNMQHLGKPATIAPGTYLHEFVVSDTLHNDISYDVRLVNKRGRQLLRNSIRVEDYVLDEVATYRITATKDDYQKGDSLVFFAAAKDANGLNLLDARVELSVIYSNISTFRSGIYISDTLFVQEKKLEPTGDTRFAIATDDFPDADFSMVVNARFRNSNNEIQNKSTTISFRCNSEIIVVAASNGFVEADYQVNGQSEAAEGNVIVETENGSWQESIRFPFRQKLHPAAQSYSFYTVSEEPVSHEWSVQTLGPDLRFANRSSGDTLGFVMYNPHALEVFYTVMKGDQVVATGKGSSQTIQWWLIEKNKRQAYTVKWQYVLAGRENQHEQAIGHLYQQLNISINAKQEIFPGQRDSITITVQDRTGSPAAGVNLALLSYNSQFAKDIRMPQLPYTANYRLRSGFTRHKYEVVDPSVDLRYPLGKYQQWIKPLGLDSIRYYQMLFPSKQLFQLARSGTFFEPEVSLHVVENGVPQPVYLLYINNRLVYYLNTTVQKPYVFPVMPGYLKFSIRLEDATIELDSVYVQPGYRYHFAIDRNSLPANARLTVQPKAFTTAEKRDLENSLWRLKGDYAIRKAYVWQNGGAMEINGTMNHLIGPFTRSDSMHYFAPGRYDVKFRFEPGYQYELSPRVLRLEKMPVFPHTDKPVPIRKRSNFDWALNDTIMHPPAIQYEKSTQRLYLKLTTNSRFTVKRILPGHGSLVIEVTGAESRSIDYIVLHSDSLEQTFVFAGGIRQINNLQTGKYKILLLREDLTAAAFVLQIREKSTLFLKLPATGFQQHYLADSLASASEVLTVQVEANLNTANRIALLPSDFRTGSASIRGVIRDEKGGLPIVGAYVSILGSSYSVIADEAGRFQLAGLKAGNYTLRFSAVGYELLDQAVVVTEGQHHELKVQLFISRGLEEVVVTGYATTQRRSVTGAVVSVNYFDQELSGRAAGVSVSAASGVPGSDHRLLIRGVGSVSADTKPLYVVDGIVYDEMPPGINADDIISTEILRDAEAVAIYGARAANGAIVITTKTTTMRTRFRDYAFWHPHVQTDKNGRASVVVQYPDNITSWDTYAVGLDKKARGGLAAVRTNSYKPVMAQLSLPQFAVRGDVFVAVGKALNYTRDSFQVRSRFSIQQQLAEPNTFLLSSNASVINTHPVFAGTPDTLVLQYNLETQTGFKDGEERKLPVFPKGVAETSGRFWVLNADSTVVYNASLAGETQLYFSNHTLDIMLKELEGLRNYPYFCIEQIASKLSGLQMEKQIRQHLRQPFQRDAEMRKLLQRLQKAQRYDGSWSWWEQGAPNIYVTNYVLQALLRFRTDPLVEINIRNGLLYLQNTLPQQDRNSLLTTLSTMAMAGHVMDYKPRLNQIPYDSLNLHQRWMYVQILQHLRHDYRSLLQQLVEEKSQGMLGGVYWGTETYRWYNNTIATTVLAYRVLEREPEHRHLLPNIIQFFLEQKGGGFWRNTVETASILDAILPQLMESNQQFPSGSRVQIEGDTAFTVSSFPAAYRLGAQHQQLRIRKTGGGLVFTTAYQNSWNPEPLPQSDHFHVETHFESKGERLQQVNSGDRVEMVVTVTSKADAEFVMIEVPVPAGCILVNKTGDGWREHFKNKVVIFAEHFPKGTRKFSITLECRYEGQFTVNPTVASLMYFPVFYGRNEMRNMEIK